MGKRWSVGLSLFICAQVLAIEFENSTDVTVAFDSVLYPQAQSIPDELRGPEYQLDGGVEVFWNIQAYLSDAVSAELRYGLAATSILDTPGAEPASFGADFRVDDFPSSLNPSYNQSVDRFNLNAFTRFGDFSVGRQPISFGQAKVFSPVDVVQPADVTSFDRTYRPGVDAVRGTWLLGAVSEVDAGYVFGQDTVAFGRFKTFAVGADWELIGLSINESNTILSLGTNGGFGAYGFWQESALYLTDDAQEVRLTLGADTQFFDDLYTLVEIHYNGLGFAELGDLDLTNPFYELGTVTPTGNWYASLQSSYPINIVTALNSGITMNLNDGTGIANALMKVDATDALSVSVSGVLPLREAATPEKEFGAYPVSASVELAWVF